MAKYNIMEELIGAIRSHQTYGGKFVFPEFIQGAKKKVGKNFVTQIDIPSTHNIGDKKILDVVQDCNGNILGFRAETFDPRGEKLMTRIVTPDVKRETYFGFGRRWNRVYNDDTRNMIRYNYNGVSPYRI